MIDEKIEGIILRLLTSASKCAKADFYGATHKKLYNYCLMLTHKPETADDLLHDTYIRAFNNLKNLKEKSKCEAWLKKIAKNLFLDLLKKSYVKNETDIFEDVGVGTDSKNTMVFHDIINTLQSLSFEFREVIYLIDMEGVDYRSAADIVGVSEEAIKTRIYRARKNFIKIYNSEATSATK